MKRGDKLRLRYRVLIYNAGKNEAVGAIVARMNAAQKEFARQ